MFEQIDLNLLYFFNVTLSNPIFDTVMAFLTNSRYWLPVYLTFFGFLIWRYKWRGVRIVAALCIIVGLANIITNVAAKELIARPRPCAEGLISWIRLPDGMRHGYGLPSSHAVNNFAGAAFLALLYRSRRSFFVVMTIAAIVSFTRIYLGLHYPSDVIAGAVLGLAIGAAGFRGFILIENKFFTNKPNSI
jgi:undecaprenyl-diphosphatase